MSRIFQSTLPRGERQRGLKKRGSNRYFNPRSREGSDPCLFFHGRFTTMISIHAPARGATVEEINKSGAFKFQSTLPRGERLIYLLRLLYQILFQSTLPRGERRIEERQQWEFFMISIHAPARGATKRQGDRLGHSEFQSTLPRGERPSNS